ncbi:hypothetical protein RQP46_005477 [Phenoliferia psychrophenolica]
MTDLASHAPLAGLALQNAALAVLLHQSRVHSNSFYSAATAVAVAEVLKCIISTGAALWTMELPKSKEGGSRLARSVRTLRSQVFGKDAYKMAIPAVLYVAQNNLQYFAASNLDIPTFQVVFSMNVFTGAVMSALILHRRLSLRRWLALFALALGITTVQLPPATFDFHHGHEHLDRALGLTAAGLASALSGATGAFVELALRRSEASLWARNAQCSAFAILPALVPIFAPGVLGRFTTPSDSDGVGGLDGWAWAVIVVQVGGGLLTSLVCREDALVKITATGVSTVVLVAMSTLFFGYRPTQTFTLGTLLVLLATFTYSQSERTTSTRFNRRSGKGVAHLLGLATLATPAAPHSPVLTPPPSPLWGDEMEAHPALAASRAAASRNASPNNRFQHPFPAPPSRGYPSPPLSHPNSPEELAQEQATHTSYSFEEPLIPRSHFPMSPEPEAESTSVGGSGRKRMQAGVFRSAIHVERR